MPTCVGGSCPVDFDQLELLNYAMRYLAIKGLLNNLSRYQLAERICEEFSVDLLDLQILSELESVLAQLHAPPQAEAPHKGT